MMRLAVLALALSVGLIAWVLDRAMRLPPSPSAMPIPPMASSVTFQRSVDSAMRRLTVAVDHDPFHPERRRPTTRFRLPGEPVAHPVLALASGPVSAPFRLVGTAVLAEGHGFAMCERGGDSPRLVRIGEQIGGFTLRTLARDTAIFVAADGTPMELHVAKVGP